MISMSGRLFVFSINFVIGPISYQKHNFKILNNNILVKRPLEKLHLHPKWGPDTHNSTHQRGAVSKAEQPRFVQKNHFKISNHFLSYKLVYLMNLNILIQILKLLLNTFLFQMGTLTGPNIHKHPVTFMNNHLHSMTITKTHFHSCALT